jgi:hypothetical protein
MSEQLAALMPFWYDKIEHLYIPEFDLDWLSFQHLVFKQYLLINYNQC